MEDLIFIKNEEDYIKYSKLFSKQPKDRTKFKFICSECHNECIKAIRSLKIPFICKKCSAKLSSLTPERNEKMKTTCLKKYGVEFALQSEHVKEKSKQTCLEKYGVDNYSKTDEYHEKCKQMSLVQYGTEFIFQAAEVKNKIKQTTLDNYGTEYYSQSLDRKNNLQKILEKSKQTCLEKYGIEHYSKTDEYKEKCKITCNKKYNTDNYSMTEEFKQRYKDTCSKKYGVDNYAKTIECKEKYQQTCLEKYGVDNYARSNEFNINGDLEILNRNKKNNNDIIDYKDNTFTLYCPICNNTYQVTNIFYHTRINRHQNPCIHCSPIGKHYSFLEKELFDYISLNYYGKIIANDRTILNGKEIDIYLPDLKLGFEFDGTYWHADPRFFNENDIIKNKSAKEIWERDANKNLLCENAGITLIRIKEYDWTNDTENTKRFILEVINNKSKNL